MRRTLLAAVVVLVGCGKPSGAADAASDLSASSTDISAVEAPDLSVPLDLRSPDLGHTCYVVDSPPCACSRWGYFYDGAPCDQPGVACDIVQDQSPDGAVWDYMVVCGTDGRVHCTGGSCWGMPPDMN
jgi:hypothetical protein